MILNLKYIFITHGHIDHFYYLPEIKKQFPKVIWCINKEEYQGIFTYPGWALKNYGQEWVDNARSDPETQMYLDFDNQLIGVPDIFVENGQIYKLGRLVIRTILTPGHSPGGTCYYTGNILFSGDVLFYRTCGRTDTQRGSREDQIKSLRKLYEFSPDSTIVYPGHGQFTDIGSEKGRTDVSQSMVGNGLPNEVQVHSYVNNISIEGKAHFSAKNFIH